jgi:hypothetical protein
MIKKIMETTIPDTWSQEMDNAHEYILHPTTCEKIAVVMAEGVTNYLNAIKKQDKPVAFVFEELNENFIAGAIVEYHPGKNDDPGNWSYVWTFTPDDIPDNAKIVKASDTTSQHFFTSVSMNKYNFTIDPEAISIMFMVLMKTISKYLEDNASKDDINGVEIPGELQAQVAIEGDEIVKSIEPIGELKVLIKDDAAIETK